MCGLAVRLAADQPSPERSVMALFSIVQELPKRLRRLVAPRYRPEKHYMRGYGPACAARRAANG